MLVLADRGFDAGEFLNQVAATGAGFLIRLRANRKLPVLARLPHGSFLTRLGSLRVRTIQANITVTCADGTHYTASYRLATTLLDHHRYPAATLISLYHEQWEHEITYLALRHTLLNGRVRRPPQPDERPTGVPQSQKIATRLDRTFRYRCPPSRLATARR